MSEGVSGYLDTCSNRTRIKTTRCSRVQVGVDSPRSVQLLATVQALAVAYKRDTMISADESGSGPKTRLAFLRKQQPALRMCRELLR